MLVLGIEVKPPPRATTWVEENNSYYLVLLTCMKPNHTNLVMCLKNPLRYQEITWICSEIHKNFCWERGASPLSHSPPPPLLWPQVQLFWIFFHNSLASLLMERSTLSNRCTPHLGRRCQDLDGWPWEYCDLEVTLSDWKCISKKQGMNIPLGPYERKHSI